MEERWTITDDRSAEWALMTIRERNEERDRITATCMAMAREYEAKARAEMERAERDNAYLEAALWEYFSTVPHKSTKTQETYRLPGGVLKLKQQEPEMIRDEAALMEAYPEYVKNTPKLLWAELKKTRIKIANGVAIDIETGEVVKCITVQSREPKFIVEVK